MLSPKHPSENWRRNTASKPVSTKTMPMIRIMTVDGVKSPEFGLNWSSADWAAVYGGARRRRMRKIYCIFKAVFGCEN